MTWKLRLHYHNAASRLRAARPVSSWRMRHSLMVWVGTSYASLNSRQHQQKQGTHRVPCFICNEPGGLRLVGLSFAAHALQQLPEGVVLGFGFVGAAVEGSLHLDKTETGHPRKWVPR